MDEDEFAGAIGTCLGQQATPEVAQSSVVAELPLGAASLGAGTASSGGPSLGASSVEVELTPPPKKRQREGGAMPQPPPKPGQSF